MAVGGRLDAIQAAEEFAEEKLNDFNFFERRLEKLGREKKGESDEGSTRCPSECELDPILTARLWSSPEPERPLSWALGLDRGDFGAASGELMLSARSQEASGELMLSARVHERIGLVLM